MLVLGIIISVVFVSIAFLSSAHGHAQTRVASEALQINPVLRCFLCAKILTGLMPVVLCRWFYVRGFMSE